MNTDIENNVFAGALGLWLGFLLTVKGPENFTVFFFRYIFMTFLAIIALVALIKWAFYHHDEVRKRLFAYLGVLVALIFIPPAIIQARSRVPGLGSVEDWQVYLLCIIIAGWVISAEVGRYIPVLMRGR